MSSRTLTLPFACGLLAAGASAAPQCPPDAFEPNDLCAQAAPISVGAFAGLTIADAELDHYRIDVPAGQRLDLTLTVQQPDPNLGGFLILFADDGSGSPCDTFQNAVASTGFGGAAFPSTSLAWSAPKNAPATFYAQVQAFGAACTTYDLGLAIGPDPCAALPDDAFEPNDTCATATPLGLGTFGGLNAGIADPDHFSVTLAPKQVLTLAVSGLAAGEIATILAWDPSIACGDSNSVQNGGTIFGPTTGGMYLANTTTLPRTFVVRVTPNPDQGTGVGFCVGYSLSVSSEFDPCGAITGDAFDPNDTCAAAAPLDATQTDLKIHAWDQDWYSIDVPARSTLRLRSKSTQNLGVGPMQLWASCSGSTQDFLASSHPWLFNSADPRHWLQWHNEADFAVDTRLLMIKSLGAFPKPFCDTYQLEFELTLGEPFCLPTLNSSGDAALLSASGSTQVGVGTLELSAAPVPANTVGVMIFGPSNKPPMPFGGGYLCVQGPVVRLAGSGTGAQGVLATTVNWSGPASAISAGQSYSFQAWFRDPFVTPNFDLSEGLELAFQ